jgi:hypothetical protein
LTRHRGEAARIEAHHFEPRAAAFQLNPIVIERVDGKFLAFGLAHDFKKFARVEGKTFFLARFAWNLGSDADLEVGGRKANGLGIGFDEHVSENRNGVAPFDDSLDQRKTVHERLAFDDYSHGARPDSDTPRLFLS